LFEIKLIE